MTKSFLLISFSLLIFAITLVDCQSSSITSITSSFLRFRRRCPTVFPTRNQLIHSNSIVLVGLVEQIKPLDQEYDPNDPNQQTSNYLANVLVRRVLYGQRSLQRTRIHVTGFNPPQTNNKDKDLGNGIWCHPNTKQGDSWIFVLQAINYPEYFRLNSSLIKVTLTNLEKFDSIISDEPYGLRPNFPDLPCEKKYCQNNANCINDQYSPDGARCECLTHCKTSKYEPVCGSDDETYNNECDLRMRSCRAGKNLFVKGLNSCYYFRPIHGSSSYIPNRIDSTNIQLPNYYNRSYYRHSSSSLPYISQQYPLAPEHRDNNRWQSNRIHQTITTTTVNRRAFAY